MAITVTQSPTTNTAGHNPVVWKFQFTALGTGNIVKRMSYYLADSSNNQLSALKVWTPKSTSEVHTVDFSAEITALLKTSVPSSGSITTDATAVKAVKVRYREHDFDTGANPCTDTPGALTDTSVVYAWNVKMNNDNLGLFTWSNPKTGALMNSYPKRMYWGYDTDPYVWFAGDGVVRITFYTQTGSSLGQTTHTFTGANTAKSASIDYTTLGITTRPASALLEVNDGTGYVNYYISYDTCTCRDSYTGIMFLDPLGGRSFVPVKCNLENEVQRTITEVYRYGPTFTAGGTSAFNPNSQAQVKVNVPLGSLNNDTKFAQALISSPGHHLLFVTSSGVRTWHKAILSGGTYKTVQSNENTVLELQFDIADSKSGQVFDI